MFPGAATAAAIGDALATVLSDAAIAQTSKGIAAEMHAGISLAEVVHALEETAAGPAQATRAMDSGRERTAPDGVAKTE